jgi:hypothetical protein
VIEASRPRHYTRFTALHAQVRCLLIASLVWQMGVVLFGSEAAATKVGMGLAINADLIDSADLAQLQHDKHATTSKQPAASTLRHSLGDKSGEGVRAPEAVQPLAKRVDDGAQASTGATMRAGGIAVATGQPRGVSRAKRRAEQFGIRVPMTGDTLEASLQMHCEVSGAGYAIYWTRSGDQVAARALNATDTAHACAAQPARTARRPKARSYAYMHAPLPRPLPAA